MTVGSFLVGPGHVVCMNKKIRGSLLRWPFAPFVISSHKFEAINRSKALYSVCNVEYYQIFVLIDPGKLLCYNVGNKSSLSIVLE